MEHIGSKSTWNRYFMMNLVELVQAAIVMGCPMNEIEQEIFDRHAKKELENNFLHARHWTCHVGFGSKTFHIHEDRTDYSDVY